MVLPIVTLAALAASYCIATQACAAFALLVAFEIAATLSWVGVPEREHDEFMSIIERYRPEVVASVDLRQAASLG